MAFDDDDDVDYKALREQRGLEREETRNIENAFKLNLGNSEDKFLALLKGEYRTQSLPGESPKITESIGGEKLNDAFFENPYTQFHGASGRGMPSPKYEKYAEVIDILDRFKFSSDEERRKKQMNIVANAIRGSFQELTLEEVAINTRKAYGQAVKHVFQTNGGLKVVYSFNGAECVVVAKGAFFGDETICIAAKNNKLVCGVFRIDGDHSADLSKNFDLTVSKK